MKKLFLLLIVFLLFGGVVNAQSDTVKTTAADTIVIAAEHPAEFPGGMEAFYKYLAVNIRFPLEARNNHEHGRVFVQMVVEKDGSISNVHVVRKLSRSLDAEAIRVVRGSPKWVPASSNGFKVRTVYTLPISFNYGS